MKSIERFLCETCRQQLDAANLIYKQIPNSHDYGPCEWCRRHRPGARYKILFGRERKTDCHTSVRAGSQ